MQLLNYNISEGESPDSLPSDGKVTPVGSQQFALQKPHWHLAVLEGDKLRARASLWLHETPALDRQKTALVGHFEADSADSAARLLDAAKRVAAEHDCRALLGPMDGSTWFRYCWVTERGDGKPFLMEPWNPAAYPAYFEAAGVRPIAAYESSLIENLNQRDARLDRVKRRIDELGISFSRIAPETFEQDLADLYPLCLKAFQNNLFYTPVREADFRALYEPFRERMVPEFTLIARHRGEAVGFCFCMPDLNRQAAGHPLDTLIVKTLAVLPDRAYAGMGSWMTEVCQHSGLAAGMTRAIHALKAEHNRSQGLASKYGGSCYRRYHLYGCAL
ncbi:MAG: hypothetical protein ACOCVG_05500 [Verrucomicrobiota bacterium]